VAKEAMLVSRINMRESTLGWRIAPVLS